MSRRHITVDGVEYPAVEILLHSTERLVAVRLPNDSERIAVWRLTHWEWWTQWVANRGNGDG